MKQINHTDQKEWKQGDPIEVVEFEDGSTGPSAFCPESEDPLVWLQWTAAYATAQTGIHFTIECQQYSDDTYAVIVNNDQARWFNAQEATAFILGVQYGQRIGLGSNS